jgi:drug/metabolite transporter (DMT)-like permease
VSARTAAAPAAGLDDVVGCSFGLTSALVVAAAGVVASRRFPPVEVAGGWLISFLLAPTFFFLSPPREASDLPAAKQKQLRTLNNPPMMAA